MSAAPGAGGALRFISRPLLPSLANRLLSLRSPRRRGTSRYVPSLDASVVPCDLLLPCFFSMILVSLANFGGLINHTYTVFLFINAPGRSLIC